MLLNLIINLINSLLDLDKNLSATESVNMNVEFEEFYLRFSGGKYYNNLVQPANS